jgi:pimeloyl-ACP methyl ester carboxylesterase
MHANESTVQRLNVAGKTLEFSHIHGTRGPAIVMLHEGLGSIGLWRELPQQLAQTTGCDVVVYSRYGNGFSDVLTEDRAVEYMHDEALVVLPELLQALGLRDVILFGHSDGASIALIYAGAGHTVRGIIAEAPHVFVEDLSVRSIALARERFEATDLRERLGRYHADVDRTFYGWNRIWLDSAFRSWNIESYLAGIYAPVFLVQGENDEYGTRAQLQAIRDGARDARVDELYVARSGHSPHRERADIVVPAIAAFVESVRESK